jgi:hypothetical protein
MEKFQTNRKTLLLLYGFLWPFVSVYPKPASVNFNGQLSGWMTWSSSESQNGMRSQKGIRYIPVLSLDRSLSAGWTVSAEMSADAFYSARIGDFSRVASKSQIQWYRSWIRVASPRFEARIGLQKINFGSATLLRPLMWFDRMDARDPLQLTDGVYGLLLRYTFPNNANVWLWGLYGNDGLKGWEFVPTTKRDPEWGGRLQVPTPKGELAVSAHRRRMDLKKGLPGFAPFVPGFAPEDRFAVDGKWDLGIGVWCEASWIRQTLGVLGSARQRFVNLGADYTFGIWNGLHALAEYFRIDASNAALELAEGISISAFSLGVPLGMLDNLTAMLYYDWKNRDAYRFAGWQRKYDNWSFYLMGFWNPESFRINPNPQNGNPFAGKGIQLMAAWNH